MPAIKNEELHAAQCERLNQLINEIGIPESEFARHSGLASNYLFQFRKFHTTITETTANKMRVLVPNLSIAWLRSGRGEKTLDGKPFFVNDRAFADSIPQPLGPSLSNHGTTAPASSLAQFSVKTLSDMMSQSQNDNLSKDIFALVAELQHHVDELAQQLDEEKKTHNELRQRYYDLTDRINKQHEIIESMLLKDR